MIIFPLILIALQILDAYSTSKGLTIGLSESWKPMKWLFEKFGKLPVLIFGKLITSIIILAGYFLLSGYVWIIAIVYGILIVVYAKVVYNNFMLIRDKMKR